MDNNEIKELIEKVAKLASQCIALLSQVYSRLVEETDKHRWIPVTEKLPKHPKMQSEWVYVTDGERVSQGYYYDYTGREAKPGFNTGKGWCKHGSLRTISHWKYIWLPNGDKCK